MGIGRKVLFRLATSERFERTVRAVPVGEQLAWRSAQRYVAGRRLGDALRVARGLVSNGHGVSIDLFGERVEDPAVAEAVVDEYRALAAELPAPPADCWLSVDLTHLAIDVDPGGAADRLAAIAECLTGERRVQVGAEDLCRADAVLTCVLDVSGRGLAHRIGATVQANLLRSRQDLDALIGAGVHIRLVKGAYVEAGGAHPYGEPTDVAYLRLGRRLIERDAAWSMATHDGRLQEALLMAGGLIPVEHLLGVRPAVLDDLRQRNVPTRVYVPYGDNWFRYWMRRVAESRGA